MLMTRLLKMLALVCIMRDFRGLDAHIIVLHYKDDECEKRKYCKDEDRLLFAVAREHSYSDRPFNPSG